MERTPSVDKMNVRMVEDDTEYDSASVLDSNLVAIYLLVNPRSGSREGRSYTELDKDQFTIDLETGDKAELNIINITDPEQMVEYKKNILKRSKAMGESLRKSEVKLPRKLKKLMVIIAGGDGTFMNIVQDMHKHGVDISVILFSILPFGTSNDLARTFNWGATPTAQMRNNLSYLCNILNNAKIVPFDIWEIQIKTDKETGDIQVPSGKDLVSIGSQEMTKLMCHSFSFGLDARIGLNFERRRTRNRFCNQVRYVLEGLKRAMC